MREGLNITSIKLIFCCSDLCSLNQPKISISVIDNVTECKLVTIMWFVASLVIVRVTHYYGKFQISFVLPKQRMLRLSKLPVGIPGSTGFSTIPHGHSFKSPYSLNDPGGGRDIWNLLHWSF